MTPVIARRHGCCATRLTAAPRWSRPPRYAWCMSRLASPLRLGPVRVPLVVVGIIVATTLVSLAAVNGARIGHYDLLQGCLLGGPQVLRGQLWRLLSYVLVELDALPLVFAALTLGWVGRDLVRAWGGRGFLVAYAGLALAAGAVTTLVGLLWPAVAHIGHGGAWIVLDGLLVAWGTLHRTRQIRFFGILPLSGQHLVWVTLLGTVLFALFRGVALYVPNFASELLVLAWLGPVARWRARQQRTQLAKRKAWTFDQWLDREWRRKKR
jgi:membrane associated rhomboid family serine protease